MGIKLEKYYEIDPGLKERWIRLWNENRDAHPFNHPEWFTVASQNHKNSERVVVVASRNGEDLIFLCAESLVRKLALLGSPYLDKGAILAAPNMSKSDWKEVIESLLVEYNQITFQEIPQYLVNSLQIMSDKAWLMSKLSSLSPFFEVEHPHINGKRRHEIRRYTRKLDKEHGPFAIDFKPLTIQLLDVMSDIESRSTKPDRGRAEFKSQNYFDFLNNVIQRYNGMCWLGLMSLAGNPVAHYAGIVYNKKMIGLHMAFDRNYSRYSPGSVLIFNLLPLLKKQDVSIFEFGRGQSVVKSRFSGENVQLQHTLYFFKKNLPGAFSFLKTMVIWNGIFLGRRIRAKNLRPVNRVLDRLAIKR